MKDRVQEIGFSSVYIYPELPGISQKWVREPKLTLALNNQRSNLKNLAKKSEIISSTYLIRSLNLPVPTLLTKLGGLR